jgi:hypothetical protein
MIWFLPQQWLLPIQQEFKLSTCSYRRLKLPKHWEKADLKERNKNQSQQKSGQKSLLE